MAAPGPKAPTRHELDRLIIGNQIAIMKALEMLLPGGQHASGPHQLQLRITHLKDWWRFHFNEEVGFSAGYDERPPAGG